MERLRAATLELLARRREVLAAGAQHVGWKLGVGDRERIDGAVVVGYLTSATVLSAGATYRAAGLGVDLRADVELAVEISADGEVGSYGVAVELVDLAPVLDTPEAIVAANVFHRACAFGPFVDTLPPAVRATALVDGEVHATGEGRDVTGRLRAAATALAAAGERLRPGDRVITGSIVQVEVAGGGVVRAEIDGIGSVELRVLG